MERLVEWHMIWVARLFSLLESPSMDERDVALATVIAGAISVNGDKWNVMSRAEFLSSRGNTDWVVVPVVAATAANN